MVTRSTSGTRFSIAVVVSVGRAGTITPGSGCAGLAQRKRQLFGLVVELRDEHAKGAGPCVNCGEVITWGFDGVPDGAGGEGAGWYHRVSRDRPCKGPGFAVASPVVVGDEHEEARGLWREISPEQADEHAAGVLARIAERRATTDFDQSRAGFSGVAFDMKKGDQITVDGVRYVIDEIPPPAADGMQSLRMHLAGSEVSEETVELLHGRRPLPIQGDENA